jgi:hypothetical protein
MLQKAYLQALNNQGKAQGSKIEVDFNPQSIRANYSTRGQTATSQGTGRGARAGQTSTTTTNQDTSLQGTLNVELLFDTTRTGANVQERTKLILALLEPVSAESGENAENATAVPFVQFQYGDFFFIGRISSFDETLDYFSEEGKPLRSTVSLSITKADPERMPDNPNSGGGASAAQGLSNALAANAAAQIAASGSLNASASFGAGVSGGFSAGVGGSFSSGVSGGVSGGIGGGLKAGFSAGTQPLTIAQGGESIQSVAARAGVDWRVAASINGIDNPRQLEAGAVLNLRTG